VGHRKIKGNSVTQNSKYHYCTSTYLCDPRQTTGKYTKSYLVGHRKFSEVYL